MKGCDLAILLQREECERLNVLGQDLHSGSQGTNLIALGATESCDPSFKGRNLFSRRPLLMSGVLAMLRNERLKLCNKRFGT